MSVKAIHINVAENDPNNIEAGHDARWVQGIVSKDKACILAVGGNLKITKVDNNHVKLASGVFVMQGFCIEVLDSETFSIASGAQGKERIDLIVADYQKSTPRDLYSLKVVQGSYSNSNASLPTLVKQDLHAGGSRRQEAIASVKIKGSDIVEVKNIAEMCANLNQIQDVVDKFFSKFGGTMSGNIEMNNNLIRSLGNPSSTNDATNKKYVDDKANAVINQAQKYVDYNCIKMMSEWATGTNEMPNQMIRAGWNWDGVFPNGFYSRTISTNIGVSTFLIYKQDANWGGFTEIGASGASHYILQNGAWKEIYNANYFPILNGAHVPAALKPGQLFAKI